MEGKIYTQYYLPKARLTNEDLAALSSEYTAAQIHKLSGVRERRLADDGTETCVELAVKAINNLYTKHTELAINEVDFLINCSLGQNYKAPSNAHFVHNELALSNHCGVMDTPLGCSGFIYTLGIAKGLLTSEQADNVLISTAETTSYVIHSKDIHLRMLFGDGGTATLITKAFAKNIGTFVYKTLSEGHDALKVIRSGAKDPANKAWLDLYKDEPNQLNHGKIIMDGAEIVRFSIKNVPQLVEDVLNANQLKKEAIDLFIFHQASGFILEVLRKKCKIPEEKFMVNIEHVGNTISNSIPIALADAISSGKAQPGATVMLIGFGIGLSLAGTVIKI